MFLSSYNFTNKEIEALGPKTAILPCGAFEQHGPHLPMTTDTLIAVAIAERICQQSSAFLLPPITISCSQEHHGFFGNLFISSEVLGKCIREIIDSIGHSGIKQVAIVNAHGGNYVLRNLAQEVNLTEQRLLLWPTNQHWQSAVHYAGIESTIHEDMHAGEIETSILLHLSPDLVREDQIQDHQASERYYLHLKGMKEYTSSGVIGFPSLASAEKGRLLLESLVKSACKDLEDLNNSK
jgi:creatinine amidohydrolase